MANTWSFFPDASTIIKAALRRCRGYDPEEVTTITATQYANALETMNFLLSSWQAFLVEVWCRKLGSNALTNSQGTYTVGSGGQINVNRPVTILSAWLEDTSVTPAVASPPMEQISHNDYYRIPTKTQEGTPIQYWYDPAYDGASNKGATSKGTLYLWPEPDSTTATNKVLKFYYQRPLEDFDATTDDIDMPQEWFNALRLQLALAISPEYGLQAQDYDRLKIEADAAFELAKSGDSDQDSITIAPRDPKQENAD